MLQFVGRHALMSVSSESISLFVPAENGLRVLSGITSGYNTNPLNPPRC